MQIFLKKITINLYGNNNFFNTSFIKLYYKYLSFIIFQYNMIKIFLNLSYLNLRDRTNKSYYFFLIYNNINGSLQLIEKSKGTIKTKRRSLQKS